MPESPEHRWYTPLSAGDPLTARDHSRFVGSADGVRSYAALETCHEHHRICYRVTSTPYLRQTTTRSADAHDSGDQ